MARALITAVLAALALSGCGGDDGDGPVRFQLFGDAAELKAYRDLVDAYAKETDRDVQLVEVPDREAHLAKLSTSFGAGDPPDVFLINYRNVGGYARRGVIEPPPDSFDARALYPQPVAAFTFDGRLQCVPQNVSSLVVYYNRHLFREAGLDDPARDWTYEDFMQAVRRLADPGQYAVGVEPGTVRAAAFVWSAGGDIVDDPDDATRFTLGEPAARRGLVRLVGLRNFGPSASEAEGRSLEERFIDGSLAMFLSSRREVPTFRTIEGFDWDVAPFPRAERDFSVLHSDAYCVAKEADSEAAHAFVAYAAGEEGQKLLARSGRTVPSRRSVATSSAFLDPAKPPRSSQVFLDAVPKLKRLPSHARWTEAEEAVDLALERAFYGDLSVDDAIARIEREAGPILAGE